MARPVKEAAGRQGEIRERHLREREYGGILQQVWLTCRGK